MGETLVKTEEYKDSPVGRIPKDWEIKTLGELGNFQNGLNKGKKDFGFGTKFVNILDVYPQRLKVSVLGRMNASQSEISSYQLEVGDILLDRSSVKLDGVGYPTVFEGADEPVIFCGFIIRFRLSTSAIKPRFLCELMRDEFFRNRIFQIATRSANVNVNQEQLAKLWVGFPPIPEQEQIIAIVNTIDSAIAHTSSLIAKLKQMKAGLLHDLLTRGLDENGELRDAIGHPEQFKDSPLGQIPKNWKFTEFGALIAEGPQNGIYKPESDYADNAVPIVRIDGFYDGVLANQESFRRVRLTEAEIRRYALNKEDILINRVNSIDFVGKSAIVSGITEATVFESNIMRLVLKRELILPAYAIRLICFFMQRQLRSQAKSAIAQASINQYDVRSCIVAIPSVEEQAQIVERIDTLDTRIRSEEAYREKLKLQKQGLMHDLLTGKVRVKDADKFTPASDTV